MRKRTSAGSSPVPEGFTIKLALMDALPVLFFLGSSIVLSIRFPSVLFRTGAALVVLAGSLKVSWKFVIALAHRNIVFLNRQMRFLMPAGFLLMASALIADRSMWSFSAVMKHIVAAPSVIFFIAGIIGMVFMSVYPRIFSGDDAHANWIEQWTNTAAQACIFLGILL